MATEDRFTIRAVIFDLDGVLRLWDPAIIANAECDHGLPAGALRATAFGEKLLTAAITGRLTDDAWRNQIARDLSALHGHSAQAAVTQWSDPVGAVDERVLHLIRTQRRTVTVALLTNATTRLRSDLRALALDDQFDALFNSSELGVAKPDPRVFGAACEALGLPPAACAYVDDSPTNVAAGEEFGLRAHLYRGHDELRRFLERLPTGG